MENRRTGGKLLISQNIHERITILTCLIMTLKILVSPPVLHVKKSFGFRLSAFGFRHSAFGIRHSATASHDVDFE
jgi:hypothetical protein